jgi:hypothetical protein
MEYCRLDMLGSPMEGFPGLTPVFEVPRSDDPEAKFEQRYALAVSDVYRADYAGASRACRQLAGLAGGLPASAQHRVNCVAGVVALWRGGLGGSVLDSALAAAHLRMRQPQQGVAAADEGLALCGDNGERLFESELLALKGELLQMQAEGATAKAQRFAYLDQADAAFAGALVLAHEQGARAGEPAQNRDGSVWGDALR